MDERAEMVNQEDSVEALQRQYQIIAREGDVLEPDFVVGKIFKQIPLIMQELKPIAKDQENKQQNFKFRGIDDVYNALQKIMAKHGVFTAPKILGSQFDKFTSKNGAAGVHARIKYRYRFFAEDASYFDVYSIGEGMDYGDKVSNKCAAIAHKYALLQVFCIPTDDLDDPDKESHETKPGQQQRQQSKQQQKAPPAGKPPAAEQKKSELSNDQLKRLFTIANKNGWTNDHVKEFIGMNYKKESTRDLTKDEYDSIIHFIETGDG